jgi:lactate permease
VQLPFVKPFADSLKLAFRWPFLDVVGTNGKPHSTTMYSLTWLSTAGTLLLISGLIVALVLKVGVGRAVAAYGKTLYELRWAILTVAAVLGLAYVMNASAQTTAIGLTIASVGGALAFFSPVIGWLGVAVTGSDTSSNALFGSLQVTAANAVGLPPELLAAANSSGGVLGKMLSPQNLTIAAAAVRTGGRGGHHPAQGARLEPGPAAVPGRSSSRCRPRRCWAGCSSSVSRSGSSRGRRRTACPRRARRRPRPAPPRWA